MLTFISCKKNHIKRVLKYALMYGYKDKYLDGALILCTVIKRIVVGSLLGLLASLTASP